MIEILKERTFHLQTKNTSYIFSIHPSKYPEHIYYGRKISNVEKSLLAIREKHLIQPCYSTIANKNYPDVTYDDTLSELSEEGKGDYRTPFVAISYGEKGVRNANFLFDSYDIVKGIKRFSTLTLPQAIATETEAETLEVIYKDTELNLALHLLYTIFEDSDTITRRTVITNSSKENVTVRALYSGQLDIRTDNLDLISFPGKWAAERQIKKESIESGTKIIESRGLDSSLEANPAFIIQNNKDTYLMNLVYSGAHRASISISQRGCAHIVWGINPDMFSWPLGPNEKFESPEAVMIYSADGLDGVRDISHKFINRHIRRGAWRERMKPLMFNTWEGCAFNINETKLSVIARNAKEIGLEGIVIDDGWFGARSSDKPSVGDWYVNTMKFPSGLANIANEVHHEGMLFGFWIEPECVSERSQIAKTHPDWVLGKDSSKNAIGRNQYMLDLANPDVQDWIISTVTRLVNTCHADYIKWDISRRSSDIYSSVETKDHGSYAHKYIAGLYQILRTITLQFPNLYIEGCSRFDLGMLSFCPSILSSDCSDPAERLSITEGTSLVYPLSVIGVTLSPSPNAMTNRTISLDTRFESSIFGVLNYSIDGVNIDKQTLLAYQKQADFYKNYRALLQFGRFRVQESGNRTIWTISSYDSSTIFVFYFQKEVKTNTTAEKLTVDCANENYLYRFYPRERNFPDIINGKEYKEEPESYYISGSALKWAGIALSEQFCGNGYTDGMRILGDYNSRLYILKKVD